MTRSVAIALSVLVSSAALVAAQSRSTTAAKTAANTKPLEIYVPDVEGGKSSLWVTPSGQTLLIDTGSPGDRDSGRIVDAMAAAGVTKIDFLLLTHYHVDHVGGLKDLVAKIPPIAHFYDHGATVEDGAEGHQREQVAGFRSRASTGASSHRRARSSRRRSRAAARRTRPAKASRARTCRAIRRTRSR
jgi:glyoxylase-like metal-dependent hydrolase (beta-lactamase superfamily II)